MIVVMLGLIILVLLVDIILHPSMADAGTCARCGTSFRWLADGGAQCPTCGHGHEVLCNCLECH